MRSFLSLAVCYLCIISIGYAQNTSTINTKNIEIVRDSFGVPHIFGKTDAEAAFGLAWATAEDDTSNSQYLLSAIKGLLGKRLGMEGAKIDFAIQFLGTMDYVEANYEKEIPDDFKRVLEGYAAGANAYYTRYPEKLWDKKLLPIRPQHLVAGYMLGMALMGGVEGTVKKMVDGRIIKDMPKPEDGIGSNAFAFHSTKTENGNTFLAVNAHQPIEGLLSWYEAHVCSEEGWNILGALFHGSATIFLGTNENLGWGHTTGQLDEIDVYKLNMHPRKKNRYKFDGVWKKLETHHAKLTVALGKKKNFKLHVRKKYWTSVYGPTMKNDNGVFSLRMPALLELKPSVQWFRMNKARNFTEFREALDVQGLSRQNITYADKNDTIFFIANGLIPHRDRHYNWKKVLPGDTSATLWDKKYLPIDSLAHFLNPDCGYVFNTNNAGYEATCDDNNCVLPQFNPGIGYVETYNNRSLRFEEIMNENYANSTLSFQQFKDLKYDHTFPKRLTYKGDFWMDKFFQLDTAKYPDIADAIIRIKSFDRTADTLDRNFPVMLFAIYRLLQGPGERRQGVEKDDTKMEETVVACVRESKEHLIKHFGTIDVPLGKVQVLERAGKFYGINGGPDAIRAVFGDILPDGRIRMKAGDGYVQLVQFTKEGPQIESINAFGASSMPYSKHYTDQMPLFSEHRMKKMSLKKEDVYKSAERIYHPE
jgi:acyl-homoserine-lactone acylase